MSEGRFGRIEPTDDDRPTGRRGGQQSGQAGLSSCAVRYRESPTADRGLTTDLGPTRRAELLAYCQFAPLVIAFSIGVPFAILCAVDQRLAGNGEARAGRHCVDDAAHELDPSDRP